ncbi:Rv3235 family protein [Streptomyces boninensis]|uniref:Rv3235 family protein n=1 Tax=Streptomyces boninensis TaxID=2039455 RepID=UPI003B218D1F
MERARTTRGPAGRSARPRALTTRPPGRRDPRRPRRFAFPGLPRELQPHEWFAQRLLLTLSGQKPVHWMLGHTVGAAYEQLLELTENPPLRGPCRPVLAQCNGYQPDPRAIEAFARIEYGTRARALAFRLELADDNRWRCAAVDVGPGVGH